MSIEPLTITKLKHRAYYLCSNEDCSLYLVAAKDGNVSILDEKFQVSKEFSFEAEIEDISFGQDGKNLGLAFSKIGTVNIIDLDNRTIFKAESDLEFESCLQVKNFLWCIERVDEYKVQCAVYDVKEQRKITTISLEDPYGNSSFSLDYIPQHNIVVLWIASGQDGQRIIWVNFDGKNIDVQEEPYIEDTLPPTFNDVGTEFLVADDQCVFKYSYPQKEILSVYEHPEDSYLGYDLCYIDDNKALFSTEDSRIYLLDTNEMTIIKEIIISGHEPKTTEYYYPSLIGEDELCTDISYFKRFGNKILVVFKENAENSSESWEDSILIFDVNQFKWEK